MEFQVQNGLCVFKSSRCLFGLMPVILMRYIMRTFAINNTLLLNQVMLEDNFITSMIKADGNMLAFLSRPKAVAVASMVDANKDH